MTRVFMICDAYEHGVGQGASGYQQTEKEQLASAYTDPELREAYGYGFDRGQRHYFAEGA